MEVTFDGYLVCVFSWRANFVYNCRILRPVATLHMNKFSELLQPLNLIMLRDRFRYQITELALIADFDVLVNISLM